MSAKIGRNDLCPCGSGKKYKNCCENRGLRIRSQMTNKLLLAFGLLLGLAVVSTAYVGVSADNNTSDISAQDSKPKVDIRMSPRTSYESPQTARHLYPAPPGPAPEGKVWSAQHGHWHDIEHPELEPREGEVKPSTSPVQPVLPTGQYFPPPPGPAPEGKVWSTEHGHWHTIAEDEAQEHGVLVPQPPGPAPPGKVWSPEHGHWHGPPTAEELMKDERFMKSMEKYNEVKKANVKPKGQDAKINVEPGQEGSSTETPKGNPSETDN